MDEAMSVVPEKTHAKAQRHEWLRETWRLCVRPSSVSPNGGRMPFRRRDCIPALFPVFRLRAPPAAPHHLRPSEVGRNAIRPSVDAIERVRGNLGGRMRHSCRFQPFSFPQPRTSVSIICTLTPSTDTIFLHHSIRVHHRLYPIRLMRVFKHDLKS